MYVYVLLRDDRLNIERLATLIFRYIRTPRVHLCQEQE